MKIENLFGAVKKDIMDIEFKSEEFTAETISKTMFGYDKQRFEGFFRKTLKNME